MNDREAQDELTNDTEEGKRRAEIEEIIRRVQKNLARGSGKPSMTDLLRLLELRRELAKPQTEPLTIRWIDECPTPGCEE